jgi:hypothetical protein
MVSPAFRRHTPCLGDSKAKPTTLPLRPLSLPPPSLLQRLESHCPGFSLAEALVPFRAGFTRVSETPPRLEESQGEVHHLAPPPPSRVSLVFARTPGTVLPSAYTPCNGTFISEKAISEEAEAWPEDETGTTNTPLPAARQVFADRFASQAPHTRSGALRTVRGSSTWAGDPWLSRREASPDPAAYQACGASNDRSLSASNARKPWSGGLRTEFQPLPGTRQRVLARWLLRSLPYLQQAAVPECAYGCLAARQQPLQGPLVRARERGFGPLVRAAEGPVRSPLACGPLASLKPPLSSTGHCARDASNDCLPAPVGPSSLAPEGSGTGHRALATATPVRLADLGVGPPGLLEASDVVKTLRCLRCI